MLSIIGIVVMVVGVLGGFLIAGGNLLSLIQPSEFVTLGGAIIGATMIGTPAYVLKGMMANFGKIFGAGKSSQDFLDILVMQYELYNKVRKEGILAIEPDANNPENSVVFKKYPKFLHDHAAVDFYCDALRQLVNGIDANAIDLSIDIEMETHEKELHLFPAVLSTMADAMPALGIVAAVLGIVVTMSHLDAPPEVLGHHIGAALVGTFLGVLAAYGFFTPLANKMTSAFLEEEMVIQCLAAGFRAFSQGLAPMVAVEVARKSIFHSFRPGLTELNNAAKKG
jgi:chemotaxis protein MotA